MKNRLHVKAPGNWVNDPNGMIYYKGQYHLFYQHFPYAPRWGTMHWGHAVSPDLIHWEHVGVALFPSLSEDQNGCFSGSAVEENGVMHLFYTGVHYNQVNPKDIHQCLDQDFTSAQLHLTSKDGMHFDVFGDKEVVIPALTDPEIGDNTHTRDPKVWKGSDAWYMVLGSTTKDHKGEALFYKSEDLSHWRLAGQAHQLLVHLLDGDSGEVSVQKLHQCGHLVPVHLQLHPQQLGFHPVVAHHHDHDAAFLIHWQQIKAAGGDAALSGSRHIGGVIHKAADGPARLRDHPVQLLHFHLEGLVNLFGLR